MLKDAGCSASIEIFEVDNAFMTGLPFFAEGVSLAGEHVLRGEGGRRAGGSFARLTCTATLDRVCHRTEAIAPRHRTAAPGGSRLTRRNALGQRTKRAPARSCPFFTVRVRVVHGVHTARTPHVCNSFSFDGAAPSDAELRLVTIAPSRAFARLAPPSFVAPSIRPLEHRAKSVPANK
jgi:hypothetical protein